MSQSKDDKSGTRPGSSDALPKRPAPTIDLKATEIKSETKPAAGAPSSAPSPASAAGTSSPSKPADPRSAASSATPNDPKSDPKAETKGAGTASSVPPVGATGKPATGSTASDKKPEPAKAASTAPVPAAAPRSGSAIGRALSYASAAVLGGIVAIFGADFAASTLGIDVRPWAPAVTSVDDLGGRVAKLEKGSGQSQASLGEQLAKANERIAKLESASKQISTLSEQQQQLAATTRLLQEKTGQGGEQAAGETAARVGKLEETIQGLAAVAQSQPGRPVPEMARLSAKLGEIEAAVASLRKGGGGSGDSAQLEARLAEARKTEAQLTEAMNQIKADSAKRVKEVEAVKTQAERLEQRIDGIKSDAGAARTTVDALKSDMTAQLQSVARQGDLKATVETVDKKVAGLEAKVDGLSKRDEERQANAERIVVSLQLANLKRAMDQGKPYAEALAEVEKTAGSLIDLAPLKAFRDKGVPTVTELSAQFRQVTRAVLEAEEDKSQATTMNRLLQSAKSVVQIRRVGEVQGDTAEARLARTEVGLKSGELDNALKEMKGLKTEVRIPAQAWIDQLEARVAVDRALKGVEEKLKTSIAAPAPAKGAK